MKEESELKNQPDEINLDKNSKNFRNLDRPTPVVQAKTAEELINSIYVNTANFQHIINTGRINGTLRSEILRIMEAYHAQFTPSAKSVEVEEVKSEKLPEYKFRKFKITGLTPDAYVELNNEEIKNINGMIPCLASRLVDYPYMFVMPDGKSCHSDCLLFETFESEKQQKQADTISRLRGDMEWIAKFCNDPACKRLAKEALKEKES